MNAAQSKMAETANQLADFFGCYTEELAGSTLRRLFNDAEKMGAVVYWGCWSDYQLDQSLQYPIV